MAVVRVHYVGIDVNVQIVSATRSTPSDFQSATALGRSLERLAHDGRMKVLIATSNSRGLPLVYNEMLDRASDDSVVVFMHDDIWIDDYYLIQRVLEGLEQFDVIGIAGNRRRVAHQPAWHYINMEFQWDAPENLSGLISHGPQPGGKVQYYGAAPAACELLDGAFLAAKKNTLVKHNVRFDPRFDFHFYDMDFCRTARQSGLRLGTWPICMTHQGAGIFGTPEWRRSHQTYLTKWGS
jgi:GT2 family glycosyltransferase